MCSGFTPISAIDEQSEPAVSAKPTDSNIFEFKVTDETSNEVFVNDTGNVDTVSADTSIADTDVAPKSPVTASSPRPLLVQTRQKTGIDHADEDCGSPVDVKPEPLEVKPEEPQITETTTEAETTTPVEPIIETFDQLNVGESLDQPIAAIIPAGIAVMAAVKVVEDLPQQRALPDPVQKESTENTDKQLVEDKIDDPVEAQVSETEVIEERTNTTNEPTLEIETGLSSISDMELANKAAPITPAPIEKVVSVASDDDMPAVTFADIQPEVHAAPTICVTKLATNAVSDITATPIEKEKNTAPVEDQTSPNLEIETEKSSVSVTEPANDDLPAVTIADIEPEVHAVPIISDTEHAVCEVPPPPIEKDESAAPFEDQSSSNQSISSNAEESLESVVELESIIVPEQSTPLNQLGAEKDVNVEESSDQPIAAIIPASIAIIAAVKVVEDVPQQSALPDLKIIPVQNDSTENMTDKIVVDKISDLVVELEKEIIVPEQSTPLVTRGAEKGAIKPHFEYPQSAEDVADEKSFIEDDENDVLTPLEHGGKPVQRTPYEMSVTIEYDDIQCGDTDNMDTEDNTTVVIESTTETNEPPVAKPVVQESVVQDAVVQELVVQEPVVQEPVVEKPVVQEPVVQDPMVQEPVVQEPVVQEPVVQEPVIQPEVQAVETVVPVVEPVVQEPVVQEPVVPNSVVKENLDRSQQIDTEIKVIVITSLFRNFTRFPNFEKKSVYCFCSFILKG